MSARLGDAPVNEQKLYRILQVVFGVILAGLLIPALIIFANGNRLHRKYWRALDDLQHERYPEAVAGLSLCAEARPHDADGWWSLSIARFYVDDAQGAQAAFERCLETRDSLLPDNEIIWRDYFRACAEGALPVGMLPSWVYHHRWRRIPDAFNSALRIMRTARDGGDAHREAAEAFEACVGRMPGRPGDVDALWGVAIARFHAGDFEASLEALGRIRNNWGKEPGEQFEAVVEYVRSCVPDEPRPLGMPLVLRVGAPYDEQQRQKAAAGEQ
ncbi:MAG: hypothetical protein JW889_04890 [Verrucomicrobia bacterium]|nr:hypothetical protein [Verrucomicrobiota bacterium]